ncbi:MAG: hypothetical protein LBC53_10400 [Spirochaetaceae bacterium]|nr:hypothetical protein [Spirochaetaceae bacterium]
MAKKHLFIINPISFRKPGAVDSFIDYVRNVFETQIKMDYDIRISRFPRHAIRTVRRYITQAGEDVTVRVYAVGGDGILFDCLNGLIGLPNAELASIPYGRSNDFIRSFGEGLFDLFRDISSMALAPVVDTDVMHCGSMYSLLYCSIGTDGETTKRILNFMENVVKYWPAFLRKSRLVYNMVTSVCGLATLMFSRDLMKQKYVIDMDGRNFTGIYSNLNMANSPCYGGDKNPVVTAMPNDGCIDALLFKGAGLLRCIANIGSYLDGEFDRDPECFILKRAKAITIHSDEPLMVGIDGEVFFETAIDIEILPWMVKIVAPNSLTYKKKRDFYEVQKMANKLLAKKQRI